MRSSPFTSAVRWAPAAAFKCGSEDGANGVLLSRWDRRISPPWCSIMNPVWTWSRWALDEYQISLHSVRAISLRVQDSELQRLADRLGAVDHVELAQDLLHVVLHRERAYLQDRADLEVALAEVDPLQNVLLAY